ncbi:hypothetical protein [Aquimonas voraii]|uniref:Uncharacterized protein n=1 Tax=Aquimonas voraii TaxID=265719 RepID=A0A1G6WAC8_9GAMM|nr:hypothetical protein [Aquimonas voraii]SDD62749.1 hypothetical protein SAMN04488509_104210 [Aquimonas voraii]
MNRLPEHDDELGWSERLRAAAPMPARTPDLWPDIAARLAQQDAQASNPAHGVPAAALRSVRTASRRRHRTFALSLLASACLLAVVVLGVLVQHPPDLAPAPMASAHPLDTLLLREAEALEREYAAAFAQFEGAPLPAALQPGLQALDLEGRRISAALAEHPRQARLLDELRRVHQRRLDLLRRGIERHA